MVAGDETTELSIRCAMCGRPFLSGLKLTPKEFASADLGSKTYECTWCGFITAYTKGDHRFLDGGTCQA